MTDAAVFNDPAPEVIETGPAPRTCVIWLHGLGADGHDFEPIVPELEWPESSAVRFVFPHAPYRAVSLNGGATMRAWYDIAVGVRGLDQNEAHIRESEQHLRGLIESEVACGIAPGRIVLAGFSQGAAMALHTGLRYPKPLAGIMALSMPIPLPGRIPSEWNNRNVAVPVFLAHGTADPIVPYPMGEYARQLLGQLGLAVEWHSYPMAHSVCPQEILDIRAWLVKVLGA